MNIINYISSSAIPIIISFIILYGVSEKNKVYDTFIEGAKEGIEIVFNIFPTLLGIFIAVGALRSSGILDLIGKALAEAFASDNCHSDICSISHKGCGS